MDKSQGRVQAGAIPVRRGGGGHFTTGGDTLLRSKVSGGGGYFTMGGRLLCDSMYSARARTRYACRAPSEERG